MGTIKITLNILRLTRTEPETLDAAPLGCL